MEGPFAGVSLRICYLFECLTLVYNTCTFRQEQMIDLMSTRSAYHVMVVDQLWPTSSSPELVPQKFPSTRAIKARNRFLPSRKSGRARRAPERSAGNTVRSRVSSPRTLGGTMEGGVVITGCTHAGTRKRVCIEDSIQLKNEKLIQSPWRAVRERAAPTPPQATLSLVNSP